MRILELFGGIGACTQALKRLGIPVQIIDYVEIDKYAVMSYNAINGSFFKPQDITKWDKNIKVDLIMHGSPCQDFSLAGKQAGGDKGTGTRSSLMYETIRIVNKLKPKYVVWENVKNLLSKKHRHNFDAYLQAMREMGYTNYYQVLNAKDYGIPQNRERVFTISILNGGEFEFPEKMKLDKLLKDVLEDEVDEKYYLSDEQVERITTSTFTQNTRRIQKKDWCDTLCARDWKDPKCIQVAQMYGTEREPNPQAGRIYSAEGLSPTMDTCSGGNRMPKVLVKNATKKGYLEAEEGDGINISGRMEYQRGNVQKQSVQTLTTKADRGVVISEKKLPGAYGRDFGSKGKHQDVNGVCNTLQAAMGEGGGNVPLVAETKCLNSKVNGKQPHVQDRIYDSEGISTAFRPSIAEPKIIDDTMGFDGKPRVYKETAPALRANRIGLKVEEKLRIRKLTPKECWRLMGFSDECFEKAQKVNSNTQLYKQAGNSIVVDVLYYIFKNLFRGNE